MPDDLNRSVAIQIMEWEIHPKMNEHSHLTGEAVYQTKDGTCLLRLDEWNPAADITDASLVVQKLELDGYPLQLLFKQLAQRNKLCVADLPRAICEIALQVSHSPVTR